MSSKITSADPTVKKINVDPKKISKSLGIFIVVLAILSISGQYLNYFTEYENAFGLIPLLNIDGELSIPAIFSVLLLFFAALLLFIITIVKRNNKDRHTAKWAVLSLGFLYMTFDEGATIHEKLMPIVHRLIGDNLPSIFYFPWVIPALIGIAVITPFFVKFLIDLPQKTRLGFLLSGAIYVGGAVGVELISGYYAGIHGMKNFGFNLIATFEELLEMFGMVLFNYTLMTYIKENIGRLQFSIKSTSKPKS